MMKTRSGSVLKHFNNTENYLSQNIVIELRRSIIQKYFGPIENKKILDVGCGNGEITLPFIRSNIVTFQDFSENMLAAVESQIFEKYKQNTLLVKADFNEYEFNDEYDVIICFGLLAYVENIENSLVKLRNALKVNGTLAIQFTNCSNLVSRLIRKTAGFSIKKNKPGFKANNISTQEIEKLVNQLGLKIVKQKKYLSVLPGLTLLPLKIRKFFYLKIINSDIFSSTGGEIIFFINKNQ